MSFAQRRLALGGVVGVLFTAACNNDNFNHRGVINAGARFQLIVEAAPTPARLLLDSVTGDLWQLRTEPAGDMQWVRVASGPTDARVLKPQEILGMRSAPTPTP